MAISLLISATLQEYLLTFKGLPFGSSLAFLAIHITQKTRLGHFTHSGKFFFLILEYTIPLENYSISHKVMFLLNCHSNSFANQHMDICFHVHLC